VVRTLTWLVLDDLTDSINACMPNANRSNIYRTLVHFAHQQSTTKAFFKVLAIPIHIWLPLHIASYCF
jgi:hypothetical protein